MQTLSQCVQGRSRASRAITFALMLAALAFTLSCHKQETGIIPPASASSTETPSNSSNAASQEKPASKFISNVRRLSSQVNERRLLADYGAVLVASGGVTPPRTLIFEDEAAVKQWQSGVKTESANVGGIQIELQSAAMKALLEARDEALGARLRITPRGTLAARRSYAQNASLWQKRVEAGLAHWTAAGRITRQEAERIRTLAPREQLREILRLESRGLYFSTSFSKSILYSVAAIGASQHLSMLALDVEENANPAVRAVLARHGWFQTVVSDSPHFTFLGATEDQLASFGLKQVRSDGRTFWIPEL